MSTLEYQWCRLSSLTGPQMHSVLQARGAVFAVEQNIVYLDADEYDLHAWHLIGWSDGKVAAYLRAIDPGCKYQEASIGRVLTMAQFRGAGFGKELMQEGLQRLAKQFPGASIRISAQAYLQKFYEEFGFQVCTEPYMEEGILHVEMLLPAEAQSVQGDS